jgi:chondroitin 4-sulfotransferase 11
MLRSIIDLFRPRKEFNGLMYRHPNRSNIFLEKYNSVYFYIPKIASSSLKTVCLQLLDETLDNKGQVHEFDYPSIQRSLLGPGDSFFKFAIVRNPFDRIVSCYNDKVVRNRGFASREAWEDLSFEEFVNKISKTPHSKMNPHFRPQYTFLTRPDGELIVDYFGKFESLTEAFETIKKRAGFPEETLLPIRNKSTGMATPEYYTKKIKEKVQSIYSKDLDLFEYEFTDS